MQNNSITSQTDIANVTVVTEENQIIVPQPITNVVEVNNPGPQGPVGPTGPQGPSVPFTNIGGDVFTTTSSLQVTGSLLVSGSSTFTNIGPAIFSGSANIVGATTMSSALVSGNVTVLGTASIGTLVVNQTVLSTGSNQLGDSANDTQTLYGTVVIPTGSFTVTGSINATSIVKASSLQASGISTLATTFYYGYLTEDNNSNRIYLNANELDFWTNGSSTMRLTKATKNVLIGTTTDVGAKLHISGSTSEALLVASSSAGPALFVSGSGRVGIGTNNPQALLDLYGTSFPQIWIRDNSGVIANLYAAGSVAIVGSVSNHPVCIRTNNNNSVMIWTNNGMSIGGSYINTVAPANGLIVQGNTGIGTNNPSASLHIRGLTTSSLSSSLLVQDSNASASFIVRDDGRVGIGKTPSSPYRLDVNGTIQSNEYLMIPAVYSLTNLQFGVSGGTVHFRMLANGNIQIFNGIPPSDSGYKLDVGGNTKIKGPGATSATTALRVENTNSSASLVVLDNGFVGINTGSADFNLDVNGTARVSGNTTFGNDIRLKTGAKLFKNDSFSVFMQLYDVSNANNYYLISHNSVGTHNFGFGVIGDGVGIASQASFNFSISRTGTRISDTLTTPAVSDASSVLDLTSTSRGFLPPRTSATSLISTPAQGLITYVTGANDGLYYYNSGSQPGWHKVLTNTGSQSITGSLTTTGNIQATGFFTNAANGIGWSSPATSIRISTNDNGANIIANNVPYFTFGNNGTSITRTSGTGKWFELASFVDFSPTSGTTTMDWLSIAPTINQTGGANGITRGLYINPTLTSAANWRAIETTSGSVIFNHGAQSLMFISSSGNIGIGTSTPAITAGFTGTHIKSATNFGSELRLDTTDADRNASLTFSTANTNKWQMFLDSTDGSLKVRDMVSPVVTPITILDGGNVGIGTSTPSASLHISGASNSTLLEIDSPAVNNAIIYVSGSGQVGIGTNSPSYRLDVSGDSRFANALSIGNPATSLGWTFSSNTLNVLQNGFITVDVAGTRHFNITNPAASTYYFRVAPSTGNILIGTATDSGAKLQITGTGATSATTALSIQNSSGTPYIFARNDSRFVVGAAATTGTRIELSSTGISCLNDSSISAMTITSDRINAQFSTIVLGTAGAVNQRAFVDAWSVTGTVWESFLSTITFAPTSGTNTFTAFSATPTINQTGGASGITRGLYINPTLTSAANFRAIETTAGNVLFQSGSTPLMLVSSSGVVSIGMSGSAYGSTGTSNGKLTINNAGGNNGLAIRIGETGYQFAIRTTTNDAIGAEFVWYDGATTTFLQYGGTLGARLGASGFAQFRANTYNPDGTATIHTGASNTERLRVTNTGLVGIGTSSPSASLHVAGTTRLSGSFNTAVSGAILTVVGSGSTQPVFTVQGSQGELFSIVDSLSGSLFSVNDISGLPILEVFSDGTTLIGDYQDPALITTTKKTANTGVTTIYSLPTSSYDGAWFDYTLRSGSDARVGTIMGMWSGSSVNYMETSASQFGNTSGFTFGMSISGSNMILSGSATTSGWTVRTIIRSI